MVRVSARRGRAARLLGVGAGRSPRLACAADRMIVSATA